MISASIWRQGHLTFPPNHPLFQNTPHACVRSFHCPFRPLPLVRVVNLPGQRGNGACATRRSAQQHRQADRGKKERNKSGRRRHDLGSPPVRRKLPGRRRRDVVRGRPARPERLRADHGQGASDPSPPAAPLVRLPRRWPTAGKAKAWRGAGAPPLCRDGRSLGSAAQRDVPAAAAGCGAASAFSRIARRRIDPIPAGRRWAIPSGSSDPDATQGTGALGALPSSSPTRCPTPPADRTRVLWH
jgi:hypothetical protein